MVATCLSFRENSAEAFNFNTKEIAAASNGEIQRSGVSIAGS